MAGQISAFDDTEYISNSNSIVRYSLSASRIFFSIRILDILRVNSLAAVLPKIAV